MTKSPKPRSPKSRPPKSGSLKSRSAKSGSAKAKAAGGSAASPRVAPAKTRKAMRRVQRAVEVARQNGEELSEWEAEFVRSLEERLDTYGSAFTDPQKGALDEALSQRQSRKVREIAKKGARSRDDEADGAGARAPKAGRTPRSGFGRRPPPRVRHIEDD